MNRRFFQLPENSDPKTRNTYLYTNLIMVGTLISVALEIYLAVARQAWQLWVGAAIGVGVFLATLFSNKLIRGGKIERAVQILIFSILAAVIGDTLVISDIGISVSLLAMILTVEMASRSTEHPERYIITGFVAGAVAILLDLFLPPYRLVAVEMQLSTPLIVGVVVVALGVMTWRGFREYRLRTKLILVILGVVMASVGITALLATQSLRSSLAQNVGGNLSALANSKAIEMRESIRREVGLLQTMTLNDVVQSTVNEASRQTPLSPAQIQRLDTQWRTAHKNHTTSPLIASVLANNTAAQLREFQKQFPDHLDVLLTDQQGLLLGAGNPSADYYKGDEDWWQLTYRERIYISQPQYDENAKTVVVIVAMTIREEKSRNVLGIIRTTVKFDSLVPSLATGSFGKSGRIVLYQPSRQELTFAVGQDGVITSTQSETAFPINDLIQAFDSKDPYFNIAYGKERVLASQAGVSFEDDVTEDALAVSKLRWRVIVFQDVNEALAPVQSQTRTIVVVALLIFVLATFAALGLAQIITGPIIRLNQAAEKVAAGDLTVEAKVETGDETGTLARTFNSMTVQLRDLIGTLERRVSERTKALATSAEISRYLSTILDERELIAEVVEQLKTAFNYYHVHIYLLDENSGDLIMAGGSGEVGASLLASGHRISKGKGLVGRAARAKAPVLVADTLQDSDWLPNPLLPETHSEAAVPIATANRILGVLDVQHHEINGLSQEDIDLLESVATQMAIGIENARSYAEAQQRAEREARATDIGQKIQSTATIESALQVAVRELGRSLGINRVRAILDASSLEKGSRK